MKSHRRPGLYISIFAAFALTNCSHAPIADGPAAESAANEDHRGHMALAHEKAAQCLRSNRPMAECQNEMMRTMEPHMGKQMRKQMRGMNHEAGGCKMMDEKKASGEQEAEAHQH